MLQGYVGVLLDCWNFVLSEAFQGHVLRRLRDDGGSNECLDEGGGREGSERLGSVRRGGPGRCLLGRTYL